MRGGAKTNVQKFVRQDSRFRFLQKSKRKSNLSVVEILLDGCFETDWSEYCINRINGYSCGYWISSDDYVPTDIHLILAENKSIPNPEDICVPSNSYSEIPSSIILKLLLTLLIFAILVINILTLLTLRKLASIYLPICHYFTYICCIEQIDCLILTADWLVSILSNYKPLMLLQLISQSSCQMIPMLFSIFRHLISGLIIGFSIDLWRFIQQPVVFLANYRSEWVKNVFILCTVLVCTINCQFFWTFDLNKGENKLLHGRMINNYMECEFSNSLPLNPIFTHYIWPITDHLLGEWLPLLASLIAAILAYNIMRKKKSSFQTTFNLSKVLINAPLVMSLYNCLIGLLVLNSMVNILPRLIYFSSKLMTSKSIHINKNNLKILLEQKILNFTSSLVEMLELQNTHSSSIIFIGSLIKYQNFIVILLRFGYFSLALKEFRQISNNYFKIFRCKQTINNFDCIRNSVTNEMLIGQTKPTIIEADKRLSKRNEEENCQKSLMVEIYC